MARKATEREKKSLPPRHAKAAASFLIRLREKRGGTQDQLAEDVGLSQFVISKGESGGKIGASALIKLADATGVLIDRIVGREGVAIDVALDYLDIDLFQRADIRRAALSLTGPRPTSAQEWAGWIRDFTTQVQVDLRTKPAAPTVLVKKSTSSRPG